MEAFITRTKLSATKAMELQSTCRDNVGLTEQICKLYTNAQKTKITLRTQTFYDKLQNDLDEIRSKFAARDEKIINITKDNVTIEYFTNNVREVFAENCEKLQEWITKNEESEGGDEASEEVEKLKEYHRQEVEALKRQLEQFRKGETHDNQNEALQNKIIELKQELRAATSEINGFQALAEELHKPPPMEMFAGEEGKFGTWFTNFMINHEKLSDPKKFSCLKALLTGEPAEMLSTLSITSKNWKIAVDMLTRNYRNLNKELGDQHDKLIHYTMDKDVATNAKKLNRVAYIAISNAKSMILEARKEEYAKMTEAQVEDNVLRTLYETLITRLISQSLDSASKLSLWGMIENLEGGQVLSIEKLLKFIEDRYLKLKATQSEKTHTPSSWMGKERRNYASSYVADIQPKNIRCPIHQTSAHAIHECRQFQKLSNKERLEVAQKNALCRCCLKLKDICDCRGTIVCKICGKKHNTMLHLDSWNPSAFHPNRPQEAARHSGRFEPKSDNNRRRKVAMHLAYFEPNDPIPTARLPTVVIQAKASNGSLVNLRALVDTGAQCPFISERATTLLNLRRTPTNAQITGLSGLKCNGRPTTVDFQIRPRFESTYRRNIKAIVLPRLTSYTAGRVVLREALPAVVMADPHLEKPGQLDMILGVAEYADVIEKDIIRIGTVVLQQTRLGYIVLHNQPDTNKRINALLSIVEPTEKEEPALYKGLSQFFEQRSENIVEKEDEIERHFLKTYRRNTDGTYTVRLPFKPNRKLGQSRQTAFARIKQVERRLNKNPKMKDLYRKNLLEYIKCGHMTRAKPQSEALYYIPHQAVIRQSSVTTPLRVVFDASARTSNGKSLNDVLHIGPRLQQDLSVVLTRFRQNKIAIIADVSRMYRRIWLHPEDRPYQRILMWDEKDSIVPYQLNTVTFGVNCAPFLAIRTLLQLARDEGNNHPIAADIIKSNFYVDDCLISTSTKMEARDAVTQLLGIMKTANLPLRKWASNEPSVLKDVDEADLLSSMEKSLEDDEPGVKVLGTKWNPVTDDFRYVIADDPAVKLTKRAALSYAAKVYDLLGTLAPVTIVGKTLIQNMWRKNLEWDTELPESLQAEWKEWQRSLKSVENLRIPRWIGYHPAGKCTLLGFSDASLEAYGCVIYMRIDQPDETIDIRFVTSKARVTPVKTVTPINEADKLTLPRLELLGALLLAELIVETKNSLKMQNANDTKIMAFSDSMITLSWIRGDESKWKKFVENRVTKIKTAVPAEHWRYVPTKDNPADMASRGMKGEDFVKSKLWWKAPTWATNKIIPQFEEPVPAEILELKREKRVTILLATAEKENDWMTDISSWIKLIRIVCYINRACSKNKPETLPINSDEFVRARRTVLKVTQKNHYAEEIAMLKEKQQVKGRLKPLTPFVDNDGLLRVGGRLRLSNLRYQEKHPIILPKLTLNTWNKCNTEGKSNITVLIIQHAHSQTLHGGESQVSEYLKEYYIPNRRNTVKLVIHRCVRCCTLRKKTAEQLMGQLPRERVTMNPPFYNSQVDYAGPIFLRASMLRKSQLYKGFIAVFVCQATKAYHLELVTGLTAENFLEAFRRFVGRRGMVKSMVSDNGGCFVRGFKMIQSEANEAKRAIRSGEAAIKEQFASLELNWKFMPSYTPHFGGLHEAGVKAVKRHLLRIIGDSKLTFEHLNTVLIRIEAVLNSRPLLRTTSDEEILTPAHFLIGRPMIDPPQPEQTDANPTRKYKLTQYMYQQFWRKWKSDYLQSLQQKPKWRTEVPNVKVNELVLLKYNNVPPLHWPKAKIIKAQPGSDGLVRVVNVQDARGHQFERGIDQLIRLPVDVESNARESTITKPSLPPLKERRYPKRKSKVNKRKSNPLKRQPKVISEDKPIKNRHNPNSATKNKPRKEKTNSPSTTARRSARLASYLMIMMIVACSFTSAATQNVGQKKEAPEKIVETGGLLFVHHKSIKVQTGTIKIKINTNFNLTESAHNLNRQTLLFEKTCASLHNNPLASTTCHTLLAALKEKKDESLRRMDASGVQSKINPINQVRSKRSEGALPYLWHHLVNWLWGDSDMEEIVNSENLLRARVTQTIDHTLNAFMGIAHQLEHRETKLQHQIKSMQEAINQDKNAWFHTMTQQEITTRLLLIKDTIDHNIDELDKSYIQLCSMQWLQPEWPQLLKNAAASINIKSTLPNINQTESLAQITMKKVNGTIQVEIKLPVFLNDSFEEFTVTALPMNNTLIKLNNTNIVIDRNSPTYFYPQESTRVILTETIDVVQQQEFRKAHSTTDCIPAKLFNNTKAICNVEKVTPPFDVWTKIGHNRFAYYSSAELIVMRCDDKQENVTSRQGVLQLNPGCIINTDTRVIRANSDLEMGNAAIKMFVIPHEDQPRMENFENQSYVPLVTWKNDTLDELDEREVKAVWLESIVNFAQESHRSTGYKFYIYAALTIIGTVAIIILWKSKCRCKDPYGQPIIINMPQPKRITETN